ncbi:MAG: P27 family phage terminase small subunit [Peptoanaerobacter stomatis]|uniref:P27 family phage terminase small subunit n=1 Tax=Peptoanaerobacter stomatis TaxID=796937 RepID=UPI003FA05063
MDLAFLAIYAYAYSSYIEISQKINSSYITTKKVKKGKTQTTVDIINPLIIAQEKYTKQIMQCSTKLGLATTDRLTVKEEKEANKFIKFLQ